MPGDLRARPGTVPASTYRIQLRAEFGFDDAGAIASYLRDLGVSHVYCSPYLHAVPGSPHGYDVVDHARLDPELGGEDAHRRMLTLFAEHALRHVLDIVPNHMAVGVASNTKWWDVLQHGQASPYAHWFDVDWAAHGGRVLLPVLSAEIDDIIECGDLSVDDTAGIVRYLDQTFPLAPGSGGAEVHDVLDRQYYVLAHWRRAATELNYRRFFDVSTLAGLRVDVPEVFDATHQRFRELIDSGSLDGIRVDHPDGLADPQAYATRLRELAGDRWVVVEKILERGEQLPRSWPVEGTTGYDSAAVVTRLFVDPAGERPLTELYEKFTGEPTDWDLVAAETRRLVVRQSFASEIAWMTRLLAPQEAPADVADALAELLAAMPVYRTYRRPAERASAPDERALAQTLMTAQRRRPDLHRVLGRLARRILDCVHPELTIRFQQTSGAVRAKGVEDTAFYRFNRLLALNEVGADPSQFAVSPASFHAWCAALQRDWPATMTTLSTHDTKRSEDVRARLALLSEVPDRWADAVGAWSKAAGRHAGVGPDRNLEYLIWQTIVGAHPLTPDRAAEYTVKAAREAKQHTSWTDPNTEFERAVENFVRNVFADEEVMRHVATFVDALHHAWLTTAVAQKLVQLTMPGVPDVYQGSELWDLSLVDPDNRRPVDFDARRRLLDKVDSGGADAAARHVAAGGPKLLVTSRALRLRRAHPEIFGPDGSYEPLRIRGSAADHVVGFMRAGRVCTIVPRLSLSAPESWGDAVVEIPGGTWRNELTGASVRGGRRRIAGLFSQFPVALLVRP